MGRLSYKMDRVDATKKISSQKEYATLDKMREKLKFIIQQARIVAESAKKTTQIAKTTL